MRNFSDKIQKECGKMNGRLWIYLAVAVYNIIVLIIYGIDKLKAKNGSWRTPEKTLILLAFLFGASGAMFGMVLFNHKTAKMKFRLLVPLALIVNVAVFVLAYKYFF